MVKLDKYGLPFDSRELSAPSKRSNKCSIAYHRIMSRRDAIYGEAVEALRLYGNDVRTELDAIAALSHDVRRSHAGSFAILSPQCDFAPNVKATPELINALSDAERAVQSVMAAIRKAGHTMNSEKKVGQYLMSRYYILEATAGELTFDNVRASAGYGDKTTSMFLALCNEWLRVMTLDTWMLAGLAGYDNRGRKKNAQTFTANKKAYADIRDMLLEIADELNVSPFMLQWSLWDYYRGHHEKHTPIFGL